MAFAPHPAWLDHAVFYEIYPQSFCDTNADGIGDFEGIIRKLDYILALGCNALWINPCFESPFRDAGYDVSDYCTAAPRYGTNEDLRRLFAEAHRRDMHVFLDLVPDHTSVDHPWFAESCRGTPNPYTDRYVWTDSVWEGLEGARSLHGISERAGSCVVNFFSHQPALNYGFYHVEKPWQQPMDAPGPQATLAAMRDVMDFWLSMGCDGFRVDMAGSLVKNDPEKKGTIALWQSIRAWLDRTHPGAALVSEWGEPDLSLAGGFHMDFLLHFGPSHYNDLFRCDEPYFSRRGRGTAAEFMTRYLSYREKAGPNGLIAFPSGNHDMARLARYLTRDEMKIAFAFLLTMPGVPFIYYGDEIGMRYVENLLSVEGGYERTGARTPMQWDTSLNAGFSAVPKHRLYIAQDPAPDRPDAASQMADPASLWRTVQALTALRRAHPALDNAGGFEPVLAEGYPLVYRRFADSERLTVAVNPAGAPCTVPCDGEILFRVGGQAALSDGALSMDGSTCCIVRNP